MEYITLPVWVSLGFVVYYTILFGVSRFIKAGQTTNTPNRTIDKYRTEYKITIRTFNKNISTAAFAWMNSIWINESLFKDSDKLALAFHHEYWHVTHKHKQKTLMMRYSLALTPLLMLLADLKPWIEWSAWLVVFINAAVLTTAAQNIFEKGANEYMNKMVKDEKEASKRTK